MYLRIAIVSSVAILVGCSGTTKIFTLEGQDKQLVPLIADQANDRRAIAFISAKNQSPNRGTEQTITPCPLPPPDVGFSIQQAMSATADVADKVDAELVLLRLQQMNELKGRTPAVVALRDVISYLCISSAQGHIGSAEQVSILNKIVDTIGTFAEADLAEAVAAQAEAKGQLTASGVNKVAVAESFVQKGYAAMEKADWGTALKAFQESEKAYPTYRNSFEYTQALQGYTKLSKQEVAKKILGKVDDAWIPAKVKTALSKMATS